MDGHHWRLLAVPRLDSSLVFAPNFFLKCIFIKRKKKWKVTEGIHPSSHIVQAEQEVLSHLPHSLFGQVCVTVRNMAPFTKGHCPSFYPVNARCSICKRHVPVQSLARGLKNPPRDALSPTSLPLLSSPGILGRWQTHILRGRNDTNELPAPRSPEETLHWVSTPSSNASRSTSPAHPAGRPAPAARPRADGPRFPVVLRNDFAAVIFALIVQGRCLCVALSLPWERRRGIVIAA